LVTARVYDDRDELGVDHRLDLLDLRVGVALRVGYRQTFDEAPLLQLVRHVFDRASRLFHPRRDRIDIYPAELIWWLVLAVDAVGRREGRACSRDKRQRRRRFAQYSWSSKRPPSVMSRSAKRLRHDSAVAETMVVDSSADFRCRLVVATSLATSASSCQGEGTPIYVADVLPRVCGVGAKLRATSARRVA
jgi:hypothetical protein